MAVSYTPVPVVSTRRIEGKNSNWIDSAIQKSYNLAYSSQIADWGTTYDVAPAMENNNLFGVKTSYPPKVETPPTVN
jgi:hypothetical protein